MARCRCPATPTGAHFPGCPRFARLAWEALTEPPARCPRFCRPAASAGRCHVRHRCARADGHHGACRFLCAHPAPQEDRGTHHRVWFGRHPDAFDSFNPYPGAAGYEVVSVPIGWRLTVTPREPAGRKFGAVMEGPDRLWLLPQEVRLMAAAARQGFRRVGRYLYPSPLGSYRDLDAARPDPRFVTNP